MKDAVISTGLVVHPTSGPYACHIQDEDGMVRISKGELPELIKALTRLRNGE